MCFLFTVDLSVSRSARTSRLKLSYFNSRCFFIFPFVCSVRLIRFKFVWHKNARLWSLQQDCGNLCLLWKRNLNQLEEMTPKLKLLWVEGEGCWYMIASKSSGIKTHWEEWNAVNEAISLCLLNQLGWTKKTSAGPGNGPLTSVWFAFKLSSSVHLVRINDKNDNSRFFVLF